MFLKNISKGEPFIQATDEDIILIEDVNKEHGIDPKKGYFLYSQLEDTNFMEKSEGAGGFVLSTGDFVLSVGTVGNGYEDIITGAYNFLVTTDEDGVTEVLPIHSQKEGVQATNTDPVIRVIDNRVFYVRASHNIYEETVYYAEMPVHDNVDLKVLEAFYDIVNHAFSSGGPFPYNVWNVRNENGYFDFKVFPLGALKGTIGLEDDVEDNDEDTGESLGED